MKNLKQGIYNPESTSNEMHRIDSKYASLSEKEHYFNNIKIDSIDEFDKWIEKCSLCHTNAYRGVNEAKYRIQTSGQIAYENECRNTMQCQTKDGYHKFINSILSRVKQSSKIREILTQHKLPINDFLYFALLQHYGYPSPLCDFSYDIKAALFFMLDQLKMSNYCAKEIENYCALYIINYEDSEFGSIQEINRTGAEYADNLIQDAKKKGYNIIGLSSQAENDFKYLPYESYKDIYYFGVHGSALGSTNVKIPSLGFTAKYEINNPRISAQSGMFIYIGDAFKSLERSTFEQSQRKHITVLNVNKNIVEDIRKKYIPILKKTDIYPNDDVSLQIIDALKEVEGLYPMDYYKRKICWARSFCQKIKCGLNLFFTKCLMK